MSEDKSGTNIVMANNKKVFRNGSLISVLGSLLIFWVGAYWAIYIPENDPVNKMIAFFGIAPLFCIGLMIFVGIVQWIINKKYISPLNERNVEISGNRKRNFYAIEVVIAFSPILITVVIMLISPLIGYFYCIFIFPEIC